METVLITGISGFLGPHLAKSLLKEGYRVVGVSRWRGDNSLPRRVREEGIHNSKNFEWVPADVREFSSIATVVAKYKPDIIFHLAAQSFVKRSFDEPLDTVETNATGTANLLEAVRRFSPDSTFVFAGSSEEYGLVAVNDTQVKRVLEKYGNVFPPLRPPELPIREENPLRPMSPYAVTKVFGDFLTREYAHSFGVDAKVLRCFNYEGPGRGPHFVTSTIVLQVLDYINGRRKYIELGNVSAFRDWSHVADVVTAFKTAALNAAPGSCYNFASERTNSVLTYLLLTLDSVGYSPERISTLEGNVVIDNPLDGKEEKLFGKRFWMSQVDKLLLQSEVQFEIEHKGILIETRRGNVKLVFDPSRFRPSDVPVLLGDATAIQRDLGVRATKALEEIIRDMLPYYSDPEIRKSIRG